ncbi:MAG TPA: N-acetylmuramoyl-L-alanine amidase, partial [Fimbriimonadaceae bacterium]|nr:N-acetylmuramoyl-L-alanine amidase [Fimbriimonadaceae bacterium]
GAVMRWNETKDAVTVRAQVRIVEKTDTGVRIDTTLPVKPSFSKLPDPDRLLIDLGGCVLPKGGIQGLPKGWRAGQFEDNTARIVVVDPSMKDQYLPQIAPTRTIQFNFGTEPSTTQPKQDEGSAGGMIDNIATPPDVQITTEPKAMLTLSFPNLASEDEDSATFMMPYTGTLVSAPSAMYLDPTNIQITIPQAKPSGSDSQQGFQSKFVSLSTATRNDNGDTVVVFSLNRPLAFELKSNQKIITLRVFKPKEAMGTLSSKVIVVDAGHGGTDNGTKWGKLYEKDINLKIAKKTAAELTKAGASVIMIRDDDSTVPLLSRPETANKSKADLYISIHINSNLTAGSVSGGITFYHMQDPVSMLFAECIQDEIAAVSKLPNMGVWSDSKIYRTKGFAVLRGATMPAVLIELGFMNHPTDRKRVQEKEFQDSVATAIVKGAKRFLGDSDGN